MRVIALIGLLVLIGVSVATTSASACPSGYARCGNACCPN